MEKILSYPLPGYVDLPKSTANWLPDRHRTALLIHDMQKYFVNFFEAGTSPIKGVMSNICMLLSVARNFNIPVFYTAQPGSMTSEQRGLLKNIWGEGMQATDEHRDIIPLLTPTKDETVLTKWRYSAFFKSNLQHHLRDLKRNQLIICGVYAHIGCLTTAIDAYSHDIETFFVSDAVADFSAEKHHLALKMAAEICAVVASTEQVIANLRK
ncbi:MULTISPECIES: isochorismatase family protein [Xenorhabdus]|uniref:isochorismatase family protein n=1 Tax=Xenorhabdus TaxID=626 RepID=UPI0006499CBE|nr:MULTISPECIES: isochorismatase family protein [Xenorhabdus]KLU15098.1 2,3-dihydro-2,3-dihydroxybenzoate synthetase [Xenorhabdus griffiniae]KOP31832.1 2,3-dihydro-2,3-dihydroxybenzoate synthetase [Xenorhabdus sp. GDc328]WFQ81257.1 isochorismatase family protein [Xenorhabdus sp. SF857]